MNRAACCARAPQYLIVYGRLGRQTEMEVCPECYSGERRSESNPDTIIRPFQRNVRAMTCLKCKIELNDGSCGCRKGI